MGHLLIVCMYVHLRFGDIIAMNTKNFVHALCTLSYMHPLSTNSSYVIDLQWEVSGSHLTLSQS